MDPRLVIVIGRKGVRLVRLVSATDKEEAMAFKLYQEVRSFLYLIDKTLKLGKKEDETDWDRKS